MSSSRVQNNFTGKRPPIALATSTTSEAPLPRRPKLFPSVECMDVDLLHGQRGDPGGVILHVGNVPITRPDVALIC